MRNSGRGRTRTRRHSRERADHLETFKKASTKASTSKKLVLSSPDTTDKEELRTTMLWLGNKLPFRRNEKKLKKQNGKFSRGKRSILKEKTDLEFVHLPRERLDVTSKMSSSSSALSSLFPPGVSQHVNEDLHRRVILTTVNYSRLPTVVL